MTTLVYSATETDAKIAMALGGGTTSPSGGIWRNVVADYGAVGDGTTDDTGAFAAAFADINAGVINRLYVPALPGASAATPTKYRICSQLPTLVAQGFTILGDGKWETQIIRDYNGVAGVGCINIGGAAIGWQIESICIASAAGRSGGSAIYVLAGADAGFTGSKASLNHVNLTTWGSDSWDNTLVFNGTLKATEPKGLRTMSLSDVEVFGAASYSVIFSGVVGLNWFGGGVWPAGGTNANSGGILITGTGAVPSVQHMIFIGSCNGLVLNNGTKAVVLECGQMGSIGGLSASVDSSSVKNWIRCPDRAGGSSGFGVNGNWLNP